MDEQTEAGWLRAVSGCGCHLHCAFANKGCHFCDVVDCA